MLLPDEPLGYQDSRGFATSPAQVSMRQVCPGTEPLNAGCFEVSVELHDQFGTVVSGMILSDNTFTASILSSSPDGCRLVAPVVYSNVTATTSSATFSNLTMEGQNNSTCSFEFDCFSAPIATAIVPAECSVLLDGCSEGYEVAEGDDKDTCVSGAFPQSRLSQQQSRY